MSQNNRSINPPYSILNEPENKRYNIKFGNIASRSNANYIFVRKNQCYVFDLLLDLYKELTTNKIISEGKKPVDYFICVRDNNNEFRILNPLQRIDVYFIIILGITIISC